MNMMVCTANKRQQCHHLETLEAHFNDKWYFLLFFFFLFLHFSFARSLSLSLLHFVVVANVKGTSTKRMEYDRNSSQYFNFAVYFFLTFCLSLSRFPFNIYSIRFLLLLLIIYSCSFHFNQLQFCCFHASFMVFFAYFWLSELSQSFSFTFWVRETEIDREREIKKQKKS